MDKQSPEAARLSQAPVVIGNIGTYLETRERQQDAVPTVETILADAEYWLPALDAHYPNGIPIRPWIEFNARKYRRAWDDMHNLVRKTGGEPPPAYPLDPDDGQNQPVAIQTAWREVIAWCERKALEFPEWSEFYPIAKWQEFMDIKGGSWSRLINKHADKWQAFPKTRRGRWKMAFLQDEFPWVVKKIKSP